MKLYKIKQIEFTYMDVWEKEEERIDKAFHSLLS